MAESMPEPAKVFAKIGSRRATGVSSGKMTRTRSK